ncbi:hypothetical protein SDC9_204793 [bioreactor metagenome]|uniref:Uncharacterized protein n=1 Tax=bioreactor metagenome TaxID=1076179 RepID=A0A645J303_9ZZZZ
MQRFEMNIFGDCLYASRSERIEIFSYYIVCESIFFQECFVDHDLGYYRVHMLRLASFKDLDIEKVEEPVIDRPYTKVDLLPFKFSSP